MAAQLGVDFDHVLGIKTKVDEKGLVSDKQDGPLTWKQGKPQALLARTQGVFPIFCCGNTYGDIALLESSTGEKLCIQTQTEKTPLYHEENKLKLHAEKKHWKVHHFFQPKARTQ